MLIELDLATLLLPFRNLVSSREPLRVGVVVDNGHPAPWVDALSAFLRQIPGIDVQLIVLSNPGRAKMRRPSWLTDRLYSASRVRFDPFGEVVVNEINSGACESVDTIRAAGCRMLIWLAGVKDTNLDLAGLAKHGVFTLRLGERNCLIPFWNEVAHGRVTSSVTIFWHESSFACGRSVRKAETSTRQGLYDLTLNAKEPLVSAIRMLASLCLEIQQEGHRSRERLCGFANEPMEWASHEGYLSTLEVGRFVVQKLTRSACLRWQGRGKESRWFVALRRKSGGSIVDSTQPDLTGFKEIPLPRGSASMADPFLWEVGGRNYLFFEEVPIGSSRGRLGCVEVFKDLSCSDMNIVLEGDYHISYPCVVNSGGELFLMPETSEARRVDLYRFSNFPCKVDLVSTLAEGVALVDTTPVFVDGRWYFFTTTRQPFMETVLFWANRLDGPWNLHPCSPISCSIRNCRSAGNLFWEHGKLFRPTQDCSVRYGYSIQMNEIIRLTPTEFEERAVNWIPPTWGPELRGTHTWNESSCLQVLDGLRLVKDLRTIDPSSD